MRERTAVTNQTDDASNANIQNILYKCASLCLRNLNTYMLNTHQTEIGFDELDRLAYFPVDAMLIAKFHR